MWIKQEVKSLIEKHSTNDPFKIADYKNIIIHFHPLHEEIMGYYRYIRNNKYIVINSNLNESIKLFTCAHELGHSQLHPRLNTPYLRRRTLYSIDKIEQEANSFAVELLMLDDDLYELKDTNITIYEAAAMYNVPKEVVHLKKI